MADGTKIYKIQINGITESVNAVDALNRQLDTLEKRINELNSKGVNIKTGGAGSALKELNAEERVLKKIWALGDKIEEQEDSRAKVLQNQKALLKEITNEVKAQAAETRLANNEYANTMNGLKAKLADIKMSMGNMDIGGDMFKKYTKEANEITKKLKEIEQSYGQFGRNVGNYANGVAEGMQQLTIKVGNSERTFTSAKQAARELGNELKTMAVQGKQGTKEYEELDKTVKQLNSTIQDTNKSSVFMDNLLDTMQGFTALGSIGTGISSLFGLDDNDFQKTMQKFASLTLVLQGIEKIKDQIKTNEGFIAKSINGIGDAIKALGDWSSKYTDNAAKGIGKLMIKWSEFGKYMMPNSGYRPDFSNPLMGDWEMKVFGKSKGVGAEDLNALEARAKKTFDKIGVYATKCANGIKIAFKAVAATVTAGLSVIATLALPEIMEQISDWVKRLNSAKSAAERAAEEMKALNRQLEIRRDLLGSQYLRKEINDEKYLEEIYNEETKSLNNQIIALQTRARLLQKNTEGWGKLTHLFNADQNVEFTGNRMSGSTIVGHGRLTSFLGAQSNDITITINSLKELEDEWGRCSDAINENKDYFAKWGNGAANWFNSVTTSVKDTEEVMRGLGNVRLSDFIARFQEVNKNFDPDKPDEYAKKLRELANEMNNSKILNSVVANLDKYIPDEGVRTAVQNIINELYRLDDAFNMTSPQQVHYWEMVRIEGMKKGWARTKAQLDEEQRYEKEQYAHTKEQRDLIDKKYEQKRKEAREQEAKKGAKDAKKAGKTLQDAENELLALRIENMKDGWAKQEAAIENERRLALQKTKDYGKYAGEITIEINKKFDKKLVDEKRKWAFEVLRVYEDLYARIQQVNRTTFGMEADTARQNTEMREMQKILEEGYKMITPTSYDSTEALEKYYKTVYDIQKDSLEKQMQIQQEFLDRELDFNKEEERMRYERITNMDNGEYVQQLRAGLITQEQFDNLMEDEKNAHNARMNALDKKYESDSKKNTEDYLNSLKQTYMDGFDNIVNVLKEKKQNIDEVMTLQPVVDNDWGVINYGKTNKNYKKALEQYDDLKVEIEKKQIELQIALQTHQISAEDFAIAQKDLDNEVRSIDMAMAQIKKSQKQLFGDLMQSLQPYIQAVGQAATSIIQSIGEINDAAFEKQMEALEKQTELLEKQLDKQKELTEKYADDVDSIEDELQTARGDRRQHLIDQLNAQMKAQRESLAQERRIEKEQERMEERKKKLEEQNNKRKKNQAITTAIINAALAISSAAVNSYPIPAIPMMALATAVGAAQVAAVKAAKYADGGLLVGKSHREGGIKVLGGTAEVEGGEYVTNKRTTAQNIDLLEFINNKKRRIDLSDLIDFYSTAPKKSIKNMSKTYLADGGVIAPRSNIELQSGVIRMLENYSQQTPVVQVVDIINKTDEVKKVQVLSGLN